MTPPQTPRRLIVFARDPVPGRVKTRLIPTLGGAAAAAVYWQMLKQTLAVAAAVTSERRELWIDTDSPQERLTRLARRHRMRVCLQSGRDLGERMANALGAATAAGDHALLIGSDCPEYDAAYLESAFAALREHDAVLGPAADGGYVLIGLRQPQATLFQDIPWGSGGVLDATRRQLRRQRLDWIELDTLHDLDEPAGLARFPRLAAIATRPPASE